MDARENKQISERRRGIIRGGLMGNVDFNGGVVLLGAAAAGAFLAAAFAVRRGSSHRRRRGVTEREPLDGKDQEENQEFLCKHLCGDEVSEIVEDEADEGGRVDQLIGQSDAGVLKEEDGEGAERCSSKEIELSGGIEGEVACFRDSSAEVSCLLEICSSPVSTRSNLGICCSSVENHLENNAEQGLAACVKEEWSMICKNNKDEDEDEEDNRRKNVNKRDDAENFEEHNTCPNLSREELQQLEKKPLQNLEMVIAKEESNFGNGVKDDSSKHPEMMIMEEDGNRNECNIIKGFVNSDVFFDEGNVEGESYINKVLDEPGGLGEQAVVIAVSEFEKCCQDPDTVMEEENADLMAHDDNSVVHIEEEVKEEHDSELCSADNGVDGLLDEVQRGTYPLVGSPIKEAALLTESCTCDIPALIMEIKETQLEENTDLNDVIQESVIGFVEIQCEKGESLLNESQENIESSLIEEYHRENKEPNSAESHERIESSSEQDNQMENEEGPMIQLQGIDVATREEKVSSEDKLPLSLEPNVMVLEPIQENNLENSEKALKIEEYHLEASRHNFNDAQELGICPIKGEGREDKTISVQSHKLETMQKLVADKNIEADVLVGEIEYHKTRSIAESNEMPGSIQSYVGGIKESQSSHIEEQEEQSAKLSFDVIKEVIKLVSVNQKKRQHQTEKNFEKNALKKSKQLRTAAGKEKITEYMFLGYPKGHLFMVLTLAAALVILAIIFHEGFHHQSRHLGKNYHKLYQIFYSSYNVTLRL